MKKISLFLFSILLLISCSSPSVKKVEKKSTSDTSKIFFADSGYSSISITHDTVGGDFYNQVKKTRTYNIVRLKRGQDYTNLLITETSVQHLSLESEGQKGYIDLSGKISEGGNLNKEIWKTHIEANNINYDWDYFEADNDGCCAAAPGKKIYRYADGEELLDLTGDLYEVEIPNTNISRYIGFKTSNSANTFPEGTDSLLLGILTMVDPISRSTQQIEVVAKNDEVASDFEMAFTDINFTANYQKEKYNDGSKILQLWSADKINDPSKIDGFSIDLKFECDKIVILKIPVKNGKLCLDGINSEFFNLKVLK